MTTDEARIALAASLAVRAGTQPRDPKTGRFVAVRASPRPRQALDEWSGPVTLADLVEAAASIALLVGVILELFA